MKEVIGALEHGKEVGNAEIWKNRATLGQLVSSVLGAAIAVAGVCGVSVNLDAGGVAAISGGVVALVGAVSALVTVVTSKRVGYRRRK